MELKEVYETLGRTYALLVESGEKEDRLYEELQKVKEERDSLKEELEFIKNTFMCESETSSSNDDF